MNDRKVFRTRYGGFWREGKIQKKEKIHREKNVHFDKYRCNQMNNYQQRRKERIKRMNERKNE